MAPSIEVQYEGSVNTPIWLNDTAFSVRKLPPRSDTVASYVPGRTIVEQHETYTYDDLKPTFPDKHWGSLEEVSYSDKGLLGDSTFKNLLFTATDVFDYNPKVGTEIHGVDPAKNGLARLIATRGVVFFRQPEEI